VAYIGFGSNLGDRCALVNQALVKVTELPTCRLTGLSSLYESAPVGYLEQGNFLNGVVRLETSLAAGELLARLLFIEQELGRVREIHWGPRTIDLDILLYGNVRIGEAKLKIPHPELVNRSFVLEPLAEIAPELIPPNFAENIARLWEHHKTSHPEVAPLIKVAVPPAGDLQEVKDGIFYRYRQSR
jgi:2-amino-4-hydroxy-6-hydroxymethyldihydropteridine diphosphokinase